MLTFITFSPLDSTHSSFSFLLHPHLKRSNIVDDTLLDLDFFLDDEARVQLWGDSPSIWSSRSDLGVYINHQLLSSDPVPLRDGDVLAVPQRRHDLKTAVRFRVEVETLELSCGVGLELDMVRMMAQEMREDAERGADNGTSSATTLSDNAAINTSAPLTFSYAALTASRSSNEPARPSPDTSRSYGIAASHSSHLDSGSTISLDPHVAQDTPARSPTPPATPQCITPMPSSATDPHSKPSSPVVLSPPDALGHRAAAGLCDKSDNMTQSTPVCHGRSPRHSIASPEDDRAAYIKDKYTVNTAALAVERMRTAWADSRRWVASTSVICNSIETALQRIRGAWLQARALVAAASMLSDASSTPTAVTKLPPAVKSSPTQEATSTDLPAALEHPPKDGRGGPRSAPYSGAPTPADSG
ncbi:hypothetical protein A4X06_0g6056 [Tilletia controversa]|uniref:FHA domain-containing protein n=1 Tax=Tilletia controversa TaxID=13291 RepID=A0A8X7MQK2_9BASI|nr:hypothetical protein A4X06_0g6056 [Tilletia controversa]